MRFITRDTDYAIRSLIFMARATKKNPKRVITVDEIVKKDGLPERFLRRILQKLSKKKVLFSYKGKSGGFSFLIPPGKIKITEIIRIFQGEVNLTNCLLKSTICPDINKCVFRKRLKKINAIIVKELEQIKITSLF